MNGKPFWGNGYATEAARRIVSYGFEELKLNRIWAAAFMRNPASSNVMKKVGMKQEGILKQHVVKWDHPEDLGYYGILRDDYCRNRH
ncbi:GNAT family N-acetyltransferase [Alicyclobacillus fastidiosus]|uniref:GNAT family protein n=1 Tax=Alicyclobacillus fastidiosus TaxID=392011 RepID=A0ABV5A8S3_9BACL|nr:GNAT family protein [Alicyclobacillus fastidiosus]WEH10646.1 GNAT family protein [Alicyclobacillus fastidiosus]